MKEELKNLIKEANNHLTPNSNVVLFGHVNPDGDAIGSTLGLYFYLKNKVKNVKVVMPNEFPDFLKWMPGSDQIICFEKSPDLAKQTISNSNILFFCDFNDLKRMNGLGDHINVKNTIKIMIDHHPQPVDFADFTISDTSVSSTAELVYEFIETIENGHINNQEIALCLLTGIITDTGLFHHNSETTRTFEIVGKLLDMGADKGLIIDKIYNDYPYHRMQLLGNTLHNRLRFYPEYASSFIYISKEDLLEYNYQNGDSEGFVNTALSISGAKFSAIFIEKEDHVKASFRSSGNFDVNLFARKHFNGGGHKNASGGKSYKSLNKTLEIFVELIKIYQKEIIQS